jgi:hypothetical protein
VGGREKALIILLPMPTLDQLKKDIENFWKLDAEEQQDAVLKIIRKCAENTDKKAFTGEVRRLSEPAEFSGLSIVFEALTPDPDKWGFFFLEEYKRLFLLAEQAENHTTGHFCFTQRRQARNEPIININWRQTWRTLRRCVENVQ